MFTMLRGTSTTRPTDAIYGILGLVGADEDGTSSVEHITVDYNKRPVDILFDTVFETWQDYGGYGLFLESLDSSLRQHNTNNLTRPKSIIKQPLALETYLNGIAISNQHRRLAELALAVYKAMCILRYGMPHFGRPAYMTSLTSAEFSAIGTMPQSSNMQLLWDLSSQVTQATRGS